MSFKLTAKQDKAFDYLTDEVTAEVLFGGGAGGGKSAFGCVWLIQCCQLYPGTRWLMGRSELKILKETTLNTFFEMSRLFGFSAGVHYTYNQQSGLIKWANGSEILLKDLKLYPADPNFDSLGSLEITGGFVDECNQITEKAWNIVKSRIRYRLDRHGLIPKLLGSCNPAKTFVYARFYKPGKEGTLPPDRAFVQALSSDNPHISRHYAANLNTLDAASRARLKDGNWEYDDDPSALISYDSIVSLWRDFQPEPATPTHITCDVARFGADQTVIAVWADWRVTEWHTVARSSVTEVAARLRILMGKYSIAPRQVIADEDGVGGGVVDIVRCRGFVNGSRPMDEPVPMAGRATPNYANLKSQCYFRLADRINRGVLSIDPGCMPVEERELLITELEQVRKRDMDKDGRQAVVPKEKVKEILGRSPDRSDTLMMREFFELKPTRQWHVA